MKKTNLKFTAAIEDDCVAVVDDEEEEDAPSDDEPAPKRRNTRNWVYVTEVIEPEWFTTNGNAIPQSFLTMCRQSPNQKHPLTDESKEAIKQLGLQFGYFSQIVKIRRVATGQANSDYKFEGQTVASQA